MIEEVVFLISFLSNVVNVLLFVLAIYGIRQWKHQQLESRREEINLEYKSLLSSLYYKIVDASIYTNDYDNSLISSARDALHVCERFHNLHFKDLESSPKQEKLEPVGLEQIGRSLCDYSSDFLSLKSESVSYDKFDWEILTPVLVNINNAFSELCKWTFIYS